MQSDTFFKRFADHQEIGRNLTDTHLSVFYDNGSDVGLWHEERASTLGTGSVLLSDDAEMARYWFRRKISSDDPEQQDKSGRWVWTSQRDNGLTPPPGARRR